MPRSAAEEPGNEGTTRHEGLLRAVTGALSVLGAGGDETRALRESFAAAVGAFAAEKALLLRVRQAEPLEMESIDAVGLEERQIDAAVAGRSVEGVSATLIRQVVDEGRPRLVTNSQFEGALASETGSLVARPHSVLAAPVTDPWTRSVLAVLYFQASAGPGGYGPADLPFLQAYATALGHAFGLHLVADRRHRAALERARSERAPEIIGETEETSRLRTELHESYLPGTAVPNPRPLLILGETGTGKDLLARYLHYYSETRGRGPFVEYNCAGLSGELAHTTLFGHVKGAFTGATEAAPGLFRAAHRGVLFLDEIGEMPARGQELLLKVLDRFTVSPQGDTRVYPVDVQVVAATGRDLGALVSEGRFRHDLYQRLKPLTLRLLPLASRRGDIRPLLIHFLAEAEKSLRKRTRGLTPEALHALLAYAWPGNVRELAGVCTALVTHARPGSDIGLDDVRKRCPEVVGAPSPQGTGYAREVLKGSFAEVRARFERELLLQRLSSHDWNVAEAALGLGISAATLYRYLQRHGLRQGGSEPR